MNQSLVRPFNDLAAFQAEIIRRPFLSLHASLMRKSIRILFAVILLLLLAATVVVLTRPEFLKSSSKPAESSSEVSSQEETAAAPPPQESAPPVMTVTVETPQQMAMTMRLPLDGDVAAWEEAALASEVNGQQLVDVLVNVGDRVEKGQVLARFSAQTTQAEVSRAEASVAEARAALVEAQSNAGRAARLRKTGAVSTQQIIQYQVAARTARARLRSARAALRAQQENLRFTVLRAPDSGLIAARSASVGSVPSAGTELFRLIRQGRLEWRAEVMESDLGRISVGDEAELKLPGQQGIKAQVRTIAPSIDAKTRTALVYFDLPADPALRAGMFLGGELLLGKSQAMTLPAQAVVPRDGFNYVYRLDQDKRVHRVKVKTGRLEGNRIEILPEPPGRLQDSDRIVVQGAGFLSEGDKVRVVDAAGAQQPSTNDRHSANSLSH
ncbi:MAG: efflux RND transporter periplasmic adaptor subunit [Lautropia sp.]|nr:efflux RND transporter periplasmic adaptor subunit [Lautropia sp.]